MPYKFISRFNLLFVVGLFLSACSSQPSVQPNKPTGINAIEAAKTRVSLGLTYLQNGNYIQAKANLDKALEFAPRYGDAHFGLAWYYQQVAENELARKYYEQAMKLDRNNGDLINSYGAFLCEMGEYREADEYLLKAATSKAYNRSAETYENLAICSHRQGNIEDALMYLRTALQHQPGRARSWYMFVELLIANGQWQEAKVAYRQYEKVVPVTADTLNLAIEIENGLGNAKVAQGYADMLQTLYPDKADKPRKVILSPVSKHRLKAIGDMPITHSRTETTARNQTASQNQLSNAVQNSAKADAANHSSTTFETQQSDEIQLHILQKGETLYQISRRYGVTVPALIDWNNIRDVSKLLIGQKIIVSDPN